MNKPLISIVVPVFNESAVVKELGKSILSVLDRLEFDFELIFINDGSTDDSAGKIWEISSNDSRIKYLEFSRNFGKEAALTAGLNHCQGKAAIMMDADLQHPPNIISQLIEKWQAGAEVVIGVRKNNVREGFFRDLGAWWYYKIMALISEGEFVPNATDFRLIDRNVIDEFCRLSERNRLTRGLIDWLGFKREFVRFQADLRTKGETRFGFLKLVKMALSSFVAQSLLPLKIAGYVGIIISFLSGLLGLFMMVNGWILNDPWDLNFSNIAKLAVLNIFLIGVVLSCLGLIALYIGNIHTEILGRTLYVIRIKSGFDNNKQST